MYTINQSKITVRTNEATVSFATFLFNFVQPCFACSNTKTCKYSDDARYFTDFSAGSFDPHSTFQNCNENNIFFLRDVVVPALRNMWKSAFLCLAGCLLVVVSHLHFPNHLNLHNSQLCLQIKKVEWLIDQQVSWPWNCGGDRCQGGRGADFKVKCCLKT